MPWPTSVLKVTPFSLKPRPSFLEASGSRIHKYSGTLLFPPQTEAHRRSLQRRNEGTGFLLRSSQLAFGLTTRTSLGPAHRGTSVTGVKFRETIGVRRAIRRKDLFRVRPHHSADLLETHCKRQQTSQGKGRCGRDTQELLTNGCVSPPHTVEVIIHCLTPKQRP